MKCKDNISYLKHMYCQKELLTVSPLSVRITVLAAICLTQAFMMWKFINFQLRRWREHAQAQTLKKKQVPSKSKSKKDKGEQRAQSTSLSAKN